MNEVLVDKIFEEGKKVVFSPIIKVAYSLYNIHIEQLIEIAKNINYEIDDKVFDDFSYKALCEDFSKIAKRMMKEIFDKSNLKNELLIRALENNLDILEEVVEFNKKMNEVTHVESTMFAIDVNERLGYDLFSDPYYYTLVRHFEMVEKAVEIYKQEGNIIKYFK